MALKKSLQLALACFLFSSCMKVGPDYVPPEINVADQWKQAADKAYLRQPGDLSKWWGVFNDPLLNRLIDESMQSNLDLKLAALRIEQARASLAISYSGYFPTGDLLPSLNWTEQSRQMSTFPTKARTHSETNLNLNTSWELDLFGRISRSVEASTADLQSSEEARNDMQVLVVSEVASAYLQLRTTQTSLQVALDNIRAQKDILNLTQTRLESGLASGLDVAQAERVLATSESDVPPLRSQLVQSINALALLLGKQPGYLTDELGIIKPIPLPPVDIMVGVPADIIRQRPDIRQAERNLAAETALIGVQRADLYPTLSLSGIFGFGALDFSRIWNWNSFGYSVGPGFLWNAFDGGRIRAQIQQQEIITAETYVQYEQTVLNALSEVENALKAYIEERERVAALERAVDASQKTLQLSSDLYKDGLADFQNVLDAETALFNNQSLLADAKGTAVINLVTLYKSLGGGWDVEEASAQACLSSSQ